MDVQAIFKRVQRQFGDEAAVQVTSDDVIRWVNDAQKEIALNNHLLQTAATTNLVSGQGQYGFPANMLQLHSIRLDGVKLNEVSIQEWDNAYGSVNINDNAQGKPFCFYVYENQYRLDPVPNYSSTNGLRLLYTRVPVEVTGLVDTPELPVQYHTRIVDYCLQQAYSLDEDWTAAGNMASQFKVNLDAQREYEFQKTTDYYPSITVLPDDRW